MENEYGDLSPNKYIEWLTDFAVELQNDMGIVSHVNVQPNAPTTILDVTGNKSSGSGPMRSEGNRMQCGAFGISAGDWPPPAEAAELKSTNSSEHWHS